MSPGGPLLLSFRRWSLLAGVLAALLCAPGELPAQADSVEVVPGLQYEAGSLHRRLLGDDYRELWTTPIRVPVLDLDTFAGGLTPIRRGGGMQTRSLHLEASDGRRFVFRSVDKYPVSTAPDVEGRLLGELIEDQVSSLHPAGAIAVPPLLEAAGILHAEPQLVVMPDDARLGEFRAEFAGMLGALEERPDEGEEDTPGFAGSRKIVGTEELLDRLEEAPTHRVEARAYLKARLLDVFMGDWDRHADQWRWARFDSAGIHFWAPIPRDRDYAFVNYDGLLLRLLRRMILPGAVRFDREYRDLEGLVAPAAALDREILAELPRALWDSIAAQLQGELTDSVIQAAVRRLPPEYRAAHRRELAATLEARRDRLGDAATRFYERLARVAEVYATDAEETALLVRRPDGAVEVQLLAAGEDGAAGARPYFQRLYTPEETREIRVFLRGGDDRAVVRGAAERGIRVRVVGGGGDDLLADSSSVREPGSWTVLYDESGENRFLPGRGTVVDRYPYTPPADTALVGLPLPDWGTRVSFLPYAAYSSENGVVIGGGPVYTRYGFRRHPYALQLSAQLRYAPLHGRFALHAAADYRSRNPDVSYLFEGYASQIEQLRFHGFGNETPATGGPRLYRTPLTEIYAAPALRLRLAPAAHLALGPVLRYAEPQLRPESPLARLRPYGSDPFGEVGVRLAATLDRRDDPVLPREGFRLRAAGTAFPPLWDVTDPFGRVRLEAVSHLPLPGTADGSVALRAGGERVWGRYPVQEAAALGGEETLRGYRDGRFLGDAALWGGAELRLGFGYLPLLVKWRLGTHLFADAGRVYWSGGSSDRWHAAAGGGLWLAFRGIVLRGSYAYGEEGRFYLSLGMPF